jgi:integrase
VRIGKNISRTVAAEIAITKRGQILKGEAGIGKKPKDVPFDKAAKEFLEWTETNKRPKTTRSYRQCVERLKQSFSGKRLGEIGQLGIERHKRNRVTINPTTGRKRGEVVVNRELACLRGLLNFARARGMFEGANPVSKKELGDKAAKFFKEPEGRLRYLENEEEEALLRHADEPLATIILTGIHAGLRVESEALTLRWPDVDLRRGFLTVLAAYAKSGEKRTVPLNSKLRTAMAQLKEEAQSEYVFVKPDGSSYRSIRTAFRTACRRAGLKDVTPHTLRHTFGSRLVMNGVDLRTVQELGGWSELAMVQRYAHLSPKHKAEAVERLCQAPENSTALFTAPPASGAAPAA